MCVCVDANIDTVGRAGLKWSLDGGVPRMLGHRGSCRIEMPDSSADVSCDQGRSLIATISIPRKSSDGQFQEVTASVLSLFFFFCSFSFGELCKIKGFIMMRFADHEEFLSRGN